MLEGPARDAAAFLVSGATAQGIVNCINALRDAHYLSSHVARKLIHIAAGQVFMGLWPLYSSPGERGRYLSVLLISLMTLRFALVGFGLMKDPKLVAGATRTGQRQDLLAGPCYYGLVHALLTLLYWRTGPVALTAAACLCMGDGLADLVGRRYGHLAGRLPHSKDKSIIGSLACLLGGFGASLALVLSFNQAGYFTHDLSLAAAIKGCAAASLAATLVESLPFAEVDNLTMPLAAAVAAQWAFP